MSTWTRREFLRASTTTLAAAGVGLLPRGWGRAAEGTAPRLAVGVRDRHLREVGEASTWAAAKRIGAEALEVQVDDELGLPNLFDGDRKYTLKELPGLQEALRAAKLRITAFAISNRFDERPDFEVEMTAKVARAAKELGTPAVRIDVVPRKLKGDEFVDLCAKTLARLVEATDDTGVAFGIENHGHATNRPEILDRLFAGISAKRLGLTLDTANFYWYGHPLSSLYGIYEKYADRVHHTHMKSIGYPEAEREKRRAIGWEYGKYTCPIDQGDIDMPRVVKILRKAGYGNDLCIENESLGRFPPAERGEILAREIRYLKKLRESREV